MRSRLSLTALALVAGLASAPCSALAQSGEQGSAEATKVLASEGAGFNTAAVQSLLNRGDAAVASGNLEQARKDYDTARAASKQLLALGDAENDIDMLEMAAVGVAVGNACELAKSSADFVMDKTNDEGGAGAAINRFIFDNSLRKLN